MIRNDMPKPHAKKSALQDDNDEQRGDRRDRRKAFYANVCVLSELCVKRRGLSFVSCSKKISLVAAALITVSTTATLFAADWPQWRGPNRDGHSSETGLLTSWPAAGPSVIWRASGLGEGYSSMSIAAGRVYTQGQQGSQEFVQALDVKTGARVWQTATGRAFRESRGNGPRGTPTVDGDRLYAMAADGALFCLETATGKAIWSQNIVQKYGGTIIPWGMSESPLVDGDRVIVMPGGRGASLVALNKMDGTLIWRSGNDTAGYSSALVADVNGVRQIIALTGDAAVGVRADNGQQLWRYPKVSNTTANIATPIVQNGNVFVSTAYDTGAALLRIEPKGVSEVYFTRRMQNHYSTSVLVGDVLYGFDNSFLVAMQFKTGEVLWRNRSVGKGSLIYADKHLYVLSEDGKIALVEARPDAYREVSRFDIPPGRYPTWAPPVIADGRLYVRAQDSLICFSIKG
jgi:outer membrane protein assembly factor BamB